MTFTQSLTKAQFRIDHTSHQNRVLILCAMLVAIVVPWYFLIYTPQATLATEAQQQISDLQNKTDEIRAKYESILNLAKNPDTTELTAKYDQIKKEIKRLNQEMTHYHHTYIDDKELARLLHSLLSDMQTVSIDNFSTKITPTAPVSAPAVPPKTVTPAVAATPTTPAIPAVPVQPATPTLSTTPKSEPPPEMTHYSLSLKGDYFSIMHFLQRIEMLKWQLFWVSLNYHVETYPQGIATIEFYTLKPGQTPVTVQRGTK